MKIKTLIKDLTYTTGHGIMVTNKTTVKKTKDKTMSKVYLYDRDESGDLQLLEECANLNKLLSSFRAIARDKLLWTDDEELEAIASEFDISADTGGDMEKTIGYIIDEVEELVVETYNQVGNGFYPVLDYAEPGAMSYSALGISGSVL